MDFNPEYFILRIPAILLALTIHECAHGWVAYRMGDSTAYNAGRVTLNPFVHLDLFGTAMLLAGPFGWAKPVPVDARYFRNPKQGTLLVSAAGPVSNVALALLLGYGLRMMGFQSIPAVSDSYLVSFIIISVTMNVGIAFFNLLPVPPLDGSNVLASLLPNRYIPGFIEKTRFLPQIFMGLIVIEWVTRIPMFSALITPLFSPFYALIHFLIFWRLP